MPSLIDLRRRIRAVKNTQQITKAMKMVAASKLRRSRERILSARPYAVQMQRVLTNLASRVDPSPDDGAGVVPAWANDTDLAELLPDAEIRRQLVESIASLPRDYFAEAIPYREPPGGSAYLLLSPAYAEAAATARAGGWQVREIVSHHYAMLTAPALVADAIEGLATPA